MAQHDYVIANQSGSAFRADLNNALAASVSINSGSSAPSTTYAYMLWVDTTNNLIKLRNSANNAWITLFTTAGKLDVTAIDLGGKIGIIDGGAASGGRLCIGDSDDLKIWHIAGSDTYFRNVTGDTYLQGHVSGSVINHLKFESSDGSTELFFNSGKRLATQDGGLNIWGCDDCACEITMNADLGTHDEDKWRLRCEATTSLWQLQNYEGSGWENNIQCQGGGSVFLNFDNSQKLWTLTTGIEVGGTIRNQGTYDNHTSETANMYVHSSPYEFYRSTSSIKYKDNVTTLTDAEADNILNCRPVTYTSKCSVDNPEDIHYGLIAEEVKDIDSRLVVFEGSEPENVKYDRFVPHLINLVKRLTDKVETLETKVAALEG